MRPDEDQETQEQDQAEGAVQEHHDLVHPVEAGAPPARHAGHEGDDRDRQQERSPDAGGPPLRPGLECDSPVRFPPIVS